MSETECEHEFRVNGWNTYQTLDDFIDKSRKIQQEYRCVKCGKIELRDEVLGE
jgi:hypothetical protein